jgi:hypothetical protein
VRARATGSQNFSALHAAMNLAPEGDEEPRLLRDLHSPILPTISKCWHPYSSLSLLGAS